MSDDLVEQSIAELLDIVRCRCHPAYRDRGMQDPDCECDSADAVKVVADRIEELEAEIKLLSEGATVAHFQGVVYARENMADRIEELEAKLAQAVELTEKSIKWLRLYGADVHREATALAELTGGKDE